ncbi:hypothetical protein IE53DRAFT_178115 [Violaceomyces palustris]|uniref:Uncharacterized protein n=1 Tax=Violaceomyces palustris TaxID=1673888 RepID=A0ACD0NSG2_9BASI|nr:hypothetical protein IE53DRAFT_178115 [Violaceomyces palustris]
MGVCSMFETAKSLRAGSPSPPRVGGEAGRRAIPSRLRGGRILSPSLIPSASPGLADAPLSSPTHTPNIPIDTSSLSPHQPLSPLLSPHRFTSPPSSRVGHQAEGFPNSLSIQTRAGGKLRSIRFPPSPVSFIIVGAPQTNKKGKLSAHPFFLHFFNPPLRYARELAPTSRGKR